MKLCSVEGCGRPVLARGWCGTHYHRWRTGRPIGGRVPSAEERFWARVEKGDECWLWAGLTEERHGQAYGRLGYRGKYVLAHRLAYELVIGPIPDGLELDHLCRVTRCVNPAHLEPVTHHENMLRGVRATATHCKHGHPFDERNTRFSLGQRWCRSCERERARRRRAVA